MYPERQKLRALAHEFLERSMQTTHAEKTRVMYANISAAASALLAVYDMRDRVSSSLSAQPAPDAHTCDSTTTVAGCAACQSAKAKDVERPPLPQGDKWLIAQTNVVGYPGVRLRLVELPDGQTFAQLWSDSEGKSLGGLTVPGPKPQRAPIQHRTPFTTMRHTMDDPMRPTLVATRMVDGSVRVEVVEPQGLGSIRERQIISVVV